MLEVQKYLESNSVDSLTETLGIKAKHHPTLPLVILNYDQIKSPKTNPIVRECRGLVLEAGTNRIVAKAFNRFFNYGEVDTGFDWSDFKTYDKEDGSLILVYFYAGEWRVNSRNSFGDEPMPSGDRTWRDMVAGLLFTCVGFDREITYVFELCSPYNKVVRRYKMPQLYLLATFHNGQEVDVEIPYREGVKPSRHYRFASIEDVREFIERQSVDPTYEGVVIRDRLNRRYKVKNPRYLELHRLYGNGGYTPKFLLPFILSGEADELLTYFPEYAADFMTYSKMVDSYFQSLQKLFAATQGIESQKEYALAIVGKSPFVGLLFSLRKEHGPNQPADALETLWRQSASMIEKHLL